MKTELLNSVIIAGDSGNDKSNMDSSYYQSIGLQPAYVVTGNGHDDLVKHVQSEVQKGAIAFVGEAPPLELVKTSQEYFNHQHYGLGSTLQGLQNVRSQLRSRLNNQEVSATISEPQSIGRLNEPQRFLA